MLELYQFQFDEVLLNWALMCLTSGEYLMSSALYRYLNEYINNFPQNIYIILLFMCRHSSVVELKTHLPYKSLLSWCTNWKSSVCFFSIDYIHWRVFSRCGSKCFDIDAERMMWWYLFNMRQCRHSKLVKIKKKKLTKRQDIVLGRLLTFLWEATIRKPITNPL